ncbi:MAG: 2,3-bisphosphoglycerate-dependent phosphoglycerate mutase [Leifsonia sp.]
MTDATADLYLLRHGESTGNAEGLFTGITDVHLTPHGVAEVQQAAQLLFEDGAVPNRIWTSALTRTVETVDAMLPVFLPATPPVIADWRLNERNYGALTGLSKAAVAEQYGLDQFFAWGRSFSTAPPPMPAEWLTEFAHTQPFRSLPRAALTATESLEDVVDRVRPFWQQELAPMLRTDGCTLVVAHGNSLRALAMIVEELTIPAVEQLNIPTGHPLRYRFDLSAETPRLVSRGYLDPDAAVEAATLLARQGGT